MVAVAHARSAKRQMNPALGVEPGAAISRGAGLGAGRPLRAPL